MSTQLPDGCNPPRRFPATILDQDAQPLSSGLVYFEIAQSIAVFWPRNGEVLDNLPSQAAILSDSMGGRFLIVDFQRCPAEIGTLHYHFRYEPYA